MYFVIHLNTLNYYIGVQMVTSTGKYNLIFKRPKNYNGPYQEVPPKWQEIVNRKMVEGGNGPPLGWESIGLRNPNGGPGGPMGGPGQMMGGPPPMMMGGPPDVSGGAGGVFFDYGATNSLEEQLKHVMALPALPALDPSLVALAMAQQSEIDKKTPSLVLRLSNMVTTNELEDLDLYEEIVDDTLDECEKLGPVVTMEVPRPPATKGIGFIYVHFENQGTADNAMTELGYIFYLFIIYNIICYFIIHFIIFLIY